MIRKLLLALLVLLTVVAILGGIKYLQIRRMTDQGKGFVPPPELVTAAPALSEVWETLLNTTGSLEAVRGVTVSAELAGRVTEIAFTSGQPVKAGDVLVRQDTSSEEARLAGVEAESALALANRDRDEKLLAGGIIARAEYDAAMASHTEANSRVDDIRAAIGKKTIRAPFGGHLGIRLVNLGQMLHEGDPVVSLQTLDPILVNFLLPQQELARLRTGLPVRVTTDAVPGKVLRGTLSAVNPEVDAATRNVRLQASLANPGRELRPGMFVDVAVELPAGEKALVVPSTAVLHAPYSASVFVVEEVVDPQSGRKDSRVRQVFVHLGEKRGDFTSIVFGLEEGATVVTTGVFKLRNGQAVRVDNSLSPEFGLSPKPGEG